MVVRQIVKTRDFRPEDMREVLEIEYEAFNDPYPQNLLEHIYDVHSDGFMVAEINNEVVGYIIGIMRWCGMGHILAIAVSSNYRRKSVGSSLMINMMDRLRRKGATYIRIEVRASNVSALKFYHNLSFRERKIIPNYYTDGEAAILMQYTFSD